MREVDLLKRLFRIRLLPILAVVAILTGCGQSDEEADAKPFVYGLTTVPASLDPHVDDSPELGPVLRGIYDTLIYRTADTYEFVPGLAEAWEISPDGLTYTFNLRQDVTFHDGTPFNAEAVRINIERILDPNTYSRKAVDLLGPVDRVEVVDQYRVSLILSAPYAPLLDGLSQPYLSMASPTALSKWDPVVYQFHQVGTGPYRFVQYDLNDQIVLERNPDYAWGPSTVTNPGVPQVENLVFRFFTDSDSRLEAVLDRQAQVIEGLTPAEARQLALDNTISLETNTIPGQPIQFILNTNRTPTSALAVRQALIMAADRLSIAQIVYQGYSPIANGPLSNSSLYYSPGVEGLYAYDPAQAAALFNTTGWIDSNQDGWRDEEGEPLVIRLTVTPEGNAPQVAALLKAQWESALQVQVRIHQVATYSMLVKAVNTNDYHGVAYSVSGLDPMLLDSLFLSSSPYNWSRYVDPELDGFLQVARTEMDDQQRAQLYALAQQRIMEQALIVPIGEQINLIGIQPGIQGLHFDATGIYPYFSDLMPEY